MKNSVKVTLLLLFVTIFTLNFYGCSKFSGGPSEAESKKLIGNQLLGEGCTLVSPVEILEKGKMIKNESGVELWPFRVRLKFKTKSSQWNGSTLGGYLMGGEAIYYISKGTDAMGNFMWNVERVGGNLKLI